MDNVYHNVLRRSDPILEKMVLSGVPREAAVQVAESEYPYFWYDFKRYGAKLALERTLRNRVFPSRLRIVR